MARPCFYHPELKSDDQLVELSPAESAHAMQSRRLALGAEVVLINGQGIKAVASIVEANKRKVILRVINAEHVSRPALELSIAVAFPKGDRQKVMVDMLTQLGVSKITPMATQYSVTKLKDAHIEKLRRVAVEACKQAQNPWLPDISSTESFAQVVSQSDSLFYADQAGLSASSLSKLDGVASVLIGPEGGFSDAEFDALKANCASAFALGQHILRTETAAIAAASLFKCE